MSAYSLALCCLAGSSVSGRLDPFHDFGEVYAGRNLDQGLKLRSSERDRSRVVQGTFEQEGEIASSDRATGLGCCGISQQLDLARIKGDLAAGEIEDDVPHEQNTRPLVGTTTRWPTLALAGVALSAVANSSGDGRAVE